MKKTLITLVLAVVICNVFALDMINPASEMSGKYLRFASYNQKNFMEFEDGFNNLSVSISKPRLWNNFAVSADFHLLGDGVYKKLNWNISPGITLYDRLTLAMSMGGISTSLDEDDLIFGEEENLSSLSLTKPNFGASVKALLWNDRLELTALSSYLNQPEMNFMDKTEKQDMLVMAKINWNISSTYNLGLSFKNENDESYYGMNFSVKFPYENINHRIELNEERVTYRPSIELFNYWYFGLGYDLYHDSNLGYKNLEIDLAYEYTGKQTPVVDLKPVDTKSKETTVEFVLGGADRFSKVQVKCNDYTVLDEREVWNAEGKTYSVPVRLEDGDNEIVVIAKSRTGVTTRFVQDVYLAPKVKERVISDKLEPYSAQKSEDSSKALSNSEENPDGIFKPRPKHVSSETPEGYIASDLVIVNMPEDYEVPAEHPYLYLVKKNDNLWDIAKKKNIYGDPLKWTNIYSNNGIITTNPDHIYPGQIFYIDNGSDFQRLERYEVKKGDNLYDISKELEPEEGRKLLIVSNKDRIKNPHMILPGRKIMIKIFRVNQP